MSELTLLNTEPIMFDCFAHEAKQQDGHKKHYCRILQDVNNCDGCHFYKPHIDDTTAGVDNYKVNLQNIVKKLIEEEKKERAEMLGWQRTADAYMPITAEHQNAAEHVKYCQGRISGLRAGLIMCEALFALQGGEAADVYK